MYTHDQVISEMQKCLVDYKKSVEQMELNTSDRKKLLALPFYLSKRRQLAEPKRGQREFDLFKKLTGKDWYDDADVSMDDEFKITEFDYENYLNPELLKDVNTDSDEFKQTIKLLNYFTYTEYEKLQEQKELFKPLMDILSTNMGEGKLTDEEVRIFLHKLQDQRTD